MSYPHAGMSGKQADRLLAQIAGDTRYRVNRIKYHDHRYGLIVWVCATGRRLEVAHPGVWAAWQQEETQA